MSLTIGRYEDVVIYDVSPIEASHILLERPWQFDKASHDGYSNKYLFDHHGIKVVLAPFDHSEVIEDQNKMIEKIKIKKRKRK